MARIYKDDLADSLLSVVYADTKRIEPNHNVSVQFKQTVGITCSRVRCYLRVMQTKLGHISFALFSCSLYYSARTSFRRMSEVLHADSLARIIPGCLWPEKLLALVRYNLKSSKNIHFGISVYFVTADALVAD